MLLPARTATLVVCVGNGAVLGEVGPLPCTTPWWPEVGEVVEAARDAFGAELSVLRLLTTVEESAGGAVTYLAQLATGARVPAALRQVSPAATAALAGEATGRLWWAEPGGLDDLGTRVDAALAGHGRHRDGPLRQRRSWNLSLVVTAPTDDGQVWFKAVPPFLADEGRVTARVRRVDPDLVPVVLAHDPSLRAVLMDHVPGEDQWGVADPTVVDAMVDRWVAVQVALAGDGDDLLGDGAHDVRPPALLRAVDDLLGRPGVLDELGAEERGAVERLVHGLPRRLEQVEECGLPDTLVHGDLHPGNWRRDGRDLTLLDWGDALLGNPLLDLRAFVERLEQPALRQRTRERWVARWVDAVPGSDPGRALRLLDPVAELVAATTYQRFLDAVEETERVYHRHDPLARLRAAVRAGADGGGDPGALPGHPPLAD